MLADNTIIQQHSSFFASPSGIVTLSVLSALSGAFALFMIRAMPAIPRFFELLDDIKELLKPADERKIGLVDRLAFIEGEATLLKERFEGHLEISARDLEQLRRDISEVRQSLTRRLAHDE